MTIVVAIEKPDNRSLIEEAVRLARAFDEPLHVVHITKLDTIRDDIGSDFDDESVPRLEAQAEDIAAEAVGDKDIPFEPVGLVGENVAQEILKYVADRSARYLIVGGRKRSPVGKALFGSTTQSILLNADCPVVTMMTRD